MRNLQQIIAFGFVGIGLGWRVEAAATTEAFCTTAFWTYNREQQSPCLVETLAKVTAFLLGACNAGTWNVSPIAFNETYAGPISARSNTCQCSTVVYSMISACASCQGAIVGTWSAWSNNCSVADIKISSFPVTIPSGVGVPAWAYQDVIFSDVWDANAAQSNNGPESSGSPDLQTTIPPTSSSLTTPQTTLPPESSSSTISYPLAVTTMPNSLSNNSSNTDAIIGGAVGAVGALALIGLIVFLFYRRRKNLEIRESQDLMGETPSSPFKLVAPQIPAGVRTFSQTVAGLPTMTSSAISDAGRPAMGRVQYDSPRNWTLYNPDDPSTFPVDGISPGPSPADRPHER